jgi:hypothetical protein
VIKRTAFLFLAAVLVGCEGTQTRANDVHPPAPGLESIGCSNLSCPIDGNPVAPGCVAEHGGHSVGFCATGCLSAWQQLDDCERTARLDAALRHAGLPWARR